MTGSPALPAPDADPLDAFQAWLRLAAGVEAHDGIACCLATADSAGRPSARIVYFRGVHHGRLAFYTNYESRKGRELHENPHAALVFHWPNLARQLRVEGAAERLPAEVSDRYFAGRGRGSQLGAWASRQSHRLSNRSELLERRDAVAERFDGADVPRPPFWGGFGLSPVAFEFWAQGEDRLHQRLRFTRRNDGWESALLAP